MKKILLAVLGIAVVGAVVYAMRPKTLNHEQEMTMPAPTSPSPQPEPAPSPTPPAAQTKTFNITGKNFSFSVNEIRVKKGGKVKINFTSTDGLHDWVVDEFAARTTRVNTGDSASVEFIADKTGTFEYYCSVSIHRQAGMKGKLIVE